MPFDDDSDDKIRRNLVFVSSAVLLGAWLNLKPIVVVEKLLGTDAASVVDSWRIWLAILALLIYLGMRYRFSAALTVSLHDLRSEKDKFGFGLVVATLQRELARYAKSQKDEDAPSFKGPFSKILASYRSQDIPASWLNFESVVIHEREENCIYAGVASFTANWKESSNPVTALHITTAFRIDPLRRFIIRLQYCIRLLTYSKTSTAFLVPMILMVAAASVCLWRLAQSLM